MAFVVENNTVTAFAEFQDVVDKDQRLFEANEGLSDDIVDQHLVRATTRILDKIRLTNWWKNYYTNRDTTITYNSVADIPAVDPDKIKSRQNDFTDLCVYTAMAEFILPSIADFGNEDNAERQKMGYYTNKADDMLSELVSQGDWYDFDDDGTISSTEKEPGIVNLKRIR